MKIDPLMRHLRHETAGDAADDAESHDSSSHRPGREMAVMIAPCIAPPDDRADQDRDIGGRLDQPGAGQDLVGIEMLGEDGIFDGAEESRMHSHRKQREEHQRDRMDDEAEAARRT